MNAQPKKGSEEHVTLACALNGGAFGNAICFAFFAGRKTFMDKAIILNSKKAMKTKQIKSIAEYR